MKTFSIESVNSMSSISNIGISKVEPSKQAFPSFDSVMGDLSQTQQTTSNTTDVKKTSSADNKDKLINSSAQTSQSSDANKAEDTKTSSLEQKDMREEDLDTLESASEKVKKILLEALNISQEDLESAMQVLGISYLDCLDKNNLTALLTKISGNTDISALITDENLYQQFSDVMTLLKGVKETLLSELGISEQDLSAMLTKMKMQNGSLLDANGSKLADSNELQKVATDSTGVAETVKGNVATGLVDAKEIAGKGEKSETNTVSAASNETGKTKAVEQQVQSDNKQQMGQQESNGQGKLTGAKIPENTGEEYQKFVPGQNVQETVMENIETTNAKANVNAESILKQIQSQIKVSTNMDTTKMEFQLYPEHFGKLTIQLASKDGVITAQITAQNALVKEVLESQIIQLRDNMNNQGLKVEAVEVTVESHAFEKNLEQGSQNPEQEQYQEQQQKNARKQLNYNELDTLEDLSQEEALVAEMMIGNGNSINYTA